MSSQKEYKDYVDLVIPVYKPDEKLDALTERIGSQETGAENIFFMQTLTDDESEDNAVTSKLLDVKGSVVTTLPKRVYDHGGTRNKGASMSEAMYVLFMTQDAVPEDDELIKKMLDTLKSDDEIAVVYARQLPNDRAGEIERYTRKFNYPEESSIKSKDDLEKLGIKTYFCSNVCAMYRHDIYDGLGGFVRHTIFNEDSIMAAHIIQAGYKIAYDAGAHIIHSHDYTYTQSFKRNFDLAVSQKQYSEIFDSVSSESEGIKLVLKTAEHLMERGRWYELPELFVGSAFKYAGYFMGKRYDRLPKEIVKKLSMNRNYWSRKND
ncbi:MAG: glycosyltransferase [Eubacterium sp.]|nr:glycosyltransferase [Eubacterium sp.]